VPFPLQLLERQPTWTVVAGVRNLVRADDVLGDLKAKHGDRLRVREPAAPPLRLAAPQYYPT